MKITKLFAVFFLLLFSCQTTMKNAVVTQRALELSSFNSKEDKLTLKRYFMSINNKAFALNPITKVYYWSGDWGGIERTKTHALSECGAGCELFAVNDEIVWSYAANEHSNTQTLETTSQPFIKQNIRTQQTTKPQKIAEQQPTTQKSESQKVSQPKPAEPKTQPTTQLTQAAQQQIQQPQPIQQQQQQPTVYAKPQLADRRIALVIGNEKYINAPLENQGC